MLKVYLFDTAWGLPNPSPFCIKLETYLKMTGLPHEVIREADTRKGPKKKIPFVEDDGELIGDSEFIIEHLRRKHGDSVDGDLDDAQRAHSYVLTRMLHDSTYWVLLHCRWVDPAGWAAVSKELFTSLPALLRPILPPLIRRSLAKSIRAHGLGRHSVDEIMGVGQADMQALATLLADRPFLLGDQPHIVDATAHAFVMSLVGPPIDNPVKRFVLAQPPLMDYYERMNERYYPGLAGAA